MVTVPWWFLKISGDKDNGLAGWMESRLDQLERVLSERNGWRRIASPPRTC
jgi:glutathione S-transferase